MKKLFRFLASAAVSTSPAPTPQERPLASGPLTEKLLTVKPSVPELRKLILFEARSLAAGLPGAKLFGTKLLASGLLAAGLLAAVLLTVSCGQVSDCDLVLDGFSEVVQIAPADSVQLETFNIIMPNRVFYYKDWLIIVKSGTDNAVDIINPKTKEKIECFRRGRGPNEILNIGSTQLIGNRLEVFDVSQQILYSLDISATLQNKQQTVFEKSSMNEGQSKTNTVRPYSVYRYGDASVVAGLFDDGTWYASIDRNGNILGSVPVENFKSTEALSVLERSSMFTSSFFSMRPDNKKGVCSTICGGIFSIFDADSNVIRETGRKIWFEPKVTKSNVERLLSPKHEQDDIRGFCSACSDMHYIYLLFSGKKLSNSDDPSFQCRHLLVYDWDGNPVRRYELEKDVCSIHLQGDRLFCASMHPAPRIYIYRL